MKTRNLFVCFLVLLSTALIGRGAMAAAPARGSLAVLVTHQDGTPAAGVEVSLVGLPWKATTDAQGRAEFPALAPGSYLVQAAAPGGQKASAPVVVAEGPNELRLQLEAAVFHEEVVVSGANPGRLAETPQAVSVLSDEALRLATQPSLGETLRREAGVRSTFYSPGASRPLLRGLGGDRIRVLQNGVDLGDASDTSPDHGVALESQQLERVEILRGPSALLYGSEALGGVVSVQGGGVPTEAVGSPFAGSLTASFASNGDQRGVTTRLAGQQGTLVWQAGGGKRRSEDYRSGFGDVANSFTRADQANLGLATLQSWGILGVALDQYETRYGSPVEQDVQVDLWRRRLELAAQLFPASGPWRALRASLAHVDYHHTEFEGPLPGTVVRNWFTAGRLELTHAPWVGFSGILGVEWRQRDLSVVGEESYLPRTASTTGSLFLWEHRELGRWRWEVGLRGDRFRHEPRGEAPPRSFTLASFATSLTWDTGSPLRPYLAVSVAGKAPNPEELYSQGPHAATGLFEVGDPRLQRERSTTAELGLLYRLEGFRLQLNLFTSRVRNFIYQTLTGEQEHGFPVAQFTQAKTRFWGGELAAHWDLLHVAEKHLELTLQGDVVRGELVDGPPLPRMAPGRVLGQLAFFDSRWRLALGAEKVFRATRTSPEETPTPGYTLLDLAISRRLVGEKRVHLVALQASNLLDAKAANHTSFFKEKSPLPGRSFQVVYQLWF